MGEVVNITNAIIEKQLAEIDINNLSVVILNELANEIIKLAARCSRPLGYHLVFFDAESMGHGVHNLRNLPSISRLIEQGASEEEVVEAEQDLMFNYIEAPSIS